MTLAAREDEISIAALLNISSENGLHILLRIIAYLLELINGNDTFLSAYSSCSHYHHILATRYLTDDSFCFLFSIAEIFGLDITIMIKGFSILRTILECYFRLQR